MPPSNLVTEGPIRILAAVTFHFRESRLQYLFQVVRAMSEYPVEALEVVIITNVDHPMALKQISDLCAPLFMPFPLRKTSQKSLLIESFPNLSNPGSCRGATSILLLTNFLGQDQLIPILYMSKMMFFFHSITSIILYTIERCLRRKD